MTAPPIRRPRTGTRRILRASVAAIPRYLRLMVGLIFDRRVSAVDKMLLAAAIGYAVSPLDLVPDLLPVLGLADDVFFLSLAVHRLIRRAGLDVVLDHWTGDPEELSDAHLTMAISAAAFFLPRAVRRRIESRTRRR
jgi:uncharacterized membrane protein YkvA (DUF1232 family)